MRTGLLALLFGVLMLPTLASASEPVPPSAAASTPPGFGSATDPWRPVKRLLGDWVGEAKGQPGTGSVTRQYRLVLGGRFVQESSESRYLATERHPLGELHQHWAMFSLDTARQAVVLRQFHLEGIVTTLLQSHPVEGAALVFESQGFENFPPHWKARTRYEFVSADEFFEVFELAAPGQAYQRYTRIHFRRRVR